MVEQGFNEVALKAHLGLWLIHWKRIAMAAAVCAVMAVLWVVSAFQPPVEGTLAYREIEAALAAREVAEEELHSARQSFEENQFYRMDPEELLTKRLIIAVELEDRTQVTDQIDPTDMILLAYHNAARTHLRGDVLVPSVLTKPQQEQLLSIGYEPEENVLQVTMTGDDEALIDSVLSTATQWYLQYQQPLEAMTQAHSLTVFPVSVTVYDRETATEMVSSREAEAYIRALEDSIVEYSGTLDKLFSKQKDWALAQTTEMLRTAFLEKKQKECEPEILDALVVGGIFGAILAALWLSLTCAATGWLLGEWGIKEYTGWFCIGRVKAAPETKDPLIRWGNRLLYRDGEKKEADLTGEVCEMVHILLQDCGIQDAAMIGLVGNVSEDALNRVTKELASAGLTVETAQLCTDRVGANRLCRKAEAVIFAGTVDRVTSTEVERLKEILDPLEKTPLGYILV